MIRHTIKSAPDIREAPVRTLYYKRTSGSIALCCATLGNAILGSYSIADIHLFRLFWRLNASLRPSPDLFPNLMAHHDRMLASSAVQRTTQIETQLGYELPS